MFLLAASVVGGGELGTLWGSPEIRRGKSEWSVEADSVLLSRGPQLSRSITALLCKLPFPLLPTNSILSSLALTKSGQNSPFLAKDLPMKEDSVW